MNNQTALRLDLAMLVLVCVLECLSLTGLELHEWLGFVLCIFVFVHVVAQWQWFTNQFQRFRKSNGYRIRINAFLNLALLFLMSAVLVSGALVSNQMAGTIGDSLGRLRIWSEIHGWANFSLIVLVGLHLALNWDWIIAALRRRRLEPAREASASDYNSPIQSKSSRHLFKLLGRSLAVLLAIFAAAGAAYFAMASISIVPLEAEPPDELGSNVSLSDPKHFVPRARPAHLSHGLEQLAVTTAAVALTVIVGRQVFRLRL